MNLLELRTQLVRLSGRYDLVVDTTDYVDNGANFYINAGQRWLDRKVDTKPTITRHFTVIAEGDVSAKIEGCRSIQQVYIIDPVEEQRTELEKKSLTWLREQYYGPTADEDYGTPAYYFPYYSNMYPKNPSALTWAKYSAYNPELDPDDTDTDVYDGVLWMPPALNEMTLEVIGHFYSTTFSDDTQSTFWSVKYPEILLMATMRSIEVFNRNSEGRKDWESAIADELASIDMDQADEDVAGVDEMEG